MNKIWKMFSQGEEKISAILSSVVKDYNGLQYDQLIMNLICLMLILKLECHGVLLGMGVGGVKLK